MSCAVFSQLDNLSLPVVPVAKANHLTEQQSKQAGPCSFGHFQSLQLLETPQNCDCALQKSYHSAQNVLLCHWQEAAQSPDMQRSSRPTDAFINKISARNA